MRGNLSKNMFLKQFHALDLFRYQGSKHSSSEEIRKVCEQAKARQHNYDIKKEKSYALFFFDEAGVPKEEKESLKELHYYLNNPVFPSLLISNDTLDAAKSNRCVEILRSSVESQDLFKLAISILKRNETDRIDDSLETKHQIEHFCSVFSNFFKDSTFFGLRDFYHFLRYIRRNVNSDQLGRIQITPDLVVKAVERNLNGLSSSKIYNIAKEMLQCFSSDRKTIETLLLRMKDKFYNNTSILQDSINDKFRTNRENKDSLDNNVRYIMIIDETGDQSAYRLLLDTKIFDTNLSLNYSLSELEEDKNDIYQTNVISTICAAMESGKFAYLTNTRAIDGSFYDLFNQFNFKVKNDYYTTISIGAKSEYKKVHENFQCIVHLEKNELRDTPQALLNRFEKFNISIKDVLNYKLSKIQKNQVELLEKIREKLMDLVSFIGLNNFYSKNIEETIDSLLLSCIVNKQSNNGYTIVALPALFLQSSDLDSNSLKYILQTLVCRLLQLVRPEAIIIKLQDQTNYFSYYIRHYFENLSPMDLNNYVKKLADQSYVQSNKQIIHLPFDPYMSNNELFKSNDDSIRCFKVDHFGTEYQLQEKIKNFIEGSSKLLLFSLLYNSNSKLIDQLRRMIDNTTIPKDKVILLLIHSKSSQFASPSTKFSIFMNDWDILYIDNSSNLAKFDLSSYIQSIFFSPSINLAEQNELTKQTIINNMERILKQIPIETQKSSASNGFYTTNSISSRATMLLHILTNTHSFLLDGFIKTFNTKLNEEKKKEIIIYQAKQIITGNTIASLSQNLKSTIEKCIDFTFSNFLRLIISDMGVVKLQQSSSMNDTFELFVNTFLEIFDYGVSIDEILVKENSNTTIIPTRKTCSKLIFSDKLISSIDATIQQQINNTSHEHENSQFSSIAKIINESNELLQYFCYDCALQLFLDDNIDENLVQILSIAICKLTESDFNNNITPFTIRETVLKNRSQIESFMITLMNFTNNQFFDSKLLVDTLQNGNLNTMETIRNNLYITVIDSLWGSINENLDKNYLTNALNSIAPIKMSNDEIVLKYRTKWEFLVLLHYALSVEENLQFDQYIKDINKNLDIITNNSKEKLDLFDKFISSIKNNNVSLVLTIYDWFKDGDEIDLFLMDKICNTELPLQTKKYLLQKVDLTIVEQYLNTHIRLQNVNYFEDDDTLFFDWKFNQLKNLTVNGIANVINDINRNTTLTSEKITLAVCDYLLVLNASNQFVNKSKEVNEEIQGNLMDRLLNLLSKDCYKYAFLSPLLKEKTTDEAISYILENRKDLEKYGNSFEKIISSITPIQFSALDLPFTYQKKHPGFEIYQYINQSFEKLDSNQMPLNEFITSIRHKCSTNNNIKWFARMSLIIIGFNKYLVNRRNCPHYNQLFNNTQSLNTLLELTDSEKPILSLLFLSQSSHRNFNINIEEALFNTRNGPSFQQFKLIINVIAFMFGIPNNNNFYKYLFDASSIPGSCDITFPSSISNNMDCNSQYQWTSPSNEPPRWVPSSKPVTLTEDTYKLLQFILFSSLALQTYIFDNAFAVYKDRMSSGVPRQGEEGEENLNENQKVRNFVWRKQDIPFMGIAFDKSKDEKFKIICNYLDLLQKFFTNHTNHILCNRVYTRVEDTREAEKRLQIIYTEAVALSTNETAIEDTETADLLVNMQTINQPVQIENEITLSIIKSKFEEELNDNKYKITSLYLTNRNLFNYSILIPYCVEFYYWILNTFNGLLLKENLEQPISKLIEIYTSKNLRHGKHIQNVFTEIANLWNRYIDENGSFGFACNRGAINIKISNDSPILLFVESSEEEPSILLAVINFLVKLHNDSVGSLEEEEEQLKRVPLHLIKIEHTMFLFTITEEKFKEIILSNMIGEMKFNWDSIEKSIKLEINALKSHKPKIDIPSKIVFKFRNDKEIVEFGVYETQIEKRVNEIVQYGEYNELIDDQHLLRKQLLSLSYTSLIDHFDTLIKIVEHCRSEKEEEEEFSFSISSSPSTISSILSDLEDSYNKKSLDNQHLDNNSKILIEPILVLEVDKIGTILLLLLDVLKSRDHLYCDIVELRKPLAETQKDILKERIDNISKEDFTLFINGICSIPNFAQEYATKRAKDNISLLEYIEEIDPLEDDDPIRSLLLEDLLLEQYVDYHKFLCSIHRQSQVVSTAITDWRDDLDSVIEITQEEEEQQSKKTKLWFEFEKKEENSVTFSEEDLCKLQEGIKQNEDEIIELKEQLINSVHSHSVREEIIELEELNDYIRPNQNKEIETASILNLNVNDVKQKTADGTCTTIIANPVNPITSDVELETVIVATSSEGNNNNEYCDGFTADELIEWLKEKTQFNSSQLEIISKFIIDKGYDGFSFLSITKDKLKETTLKNGPIDKLLRLVNEWKDNQSTVISHARNTFNSNFSTDQLVNWIKTGGIKGLSNSQIDTLTNYLSEEEYDAEGFLGLDLEESNLKGLFLFKVGQVIKDLNKY